MYVHNLLACVIVLIANCRCDISNINAYVRYSIKNNDQIKIYTVNLDPIFDYDVILSTQLKHLSEYKSVILFNTTVSTLEENDVSNMPHLEELGLRSVGLKEIKLNSFRNVPFLRFLHLERNSIRNIDGGVFNRLKVTHLFLNSNKITSINSGAFDEMEFLHRIDLSRNRIKKIDAGWFKNSSDTLRIVNLSGNLIGRIRAFAFDNVQNLQDIDLSSNRIKQIDADAFLGLKKLTSLDLSRNKLKRVADSTFESLASLKILELVMNNIKCLSGKVLQSLQNLNSVSLSTHAMSIACMQDVRRFQRQLNLTVIYL